MVVYRLSFSGLRSLSALMVSFFVIVFFSSVMELISVLISLVVLEDAFCILGDLSLSLSLLFGLSVRVHYRVVVL